MIIPPQKKTINNDCSSGDKQEANHDIEEEEDKEEEEEAEELDPSQDNDNDNNLNNNTKSTMAAGGQVAHQHVYQTISNYKRTLRNYFCFVLEMEVLEVTDLNISFLWSEYLQSVGKAMNKDNLITIGSTLHSSKRPIYILWLLDHIEHYSSLFATCKEQTTKVC
jgi:uncharacterized protein YaaR (DUF327 family)